MHPCRIPLPSPRRVTAPADDHRVARHGIAATIAGMPHASGIETSCGKRPTWRSWLIAFALALMLAGRAFAASGVEQRKIDYLIHSVEQLDGAHFIRDGRSYSSGLAIRYVHLQLRTRGGGIRTADEFIDRYATRSPRTGRPYLIRFADGHTEPTARYLRGLLATWPPGHASGD